MSKTNPVLVNLRLEVAKLVEPLYQYSGMCDVNDFVTRI